MNATIKMSSLYALQLLVPILANDENRGKWPNVVSQDVMHHIGDFKGDVLSFSGKVKGKILLPLPPQTDSVVRASELQERYELHLS